MSVQLPKVQQALAGSLALTAIVSDRITMGVAPQDQTRPYVVWFIVSAVPENLLGDRPVEDDQRVQVDCWAGGSDGQQVCRRMMQAAADACEGIGHIVFGPWYEYDAETKLHRWSFDVEVWNAR